jgi:hypothetical protein
MHHLIAGFSRRTSARRGGTGRAGTVTVMRTAVLAIALLAAAALPAAAAPHAHGVARLDVAADAATLQITLASPLDNLLGFERAPRNDAERRRAQELVATLKAGATLWRIDPAARCSAAGVELQAPVLGEGAPAKPAVSDHADLEATWSFACAGGTPAWVETGLFGSFPRLQRLDAQIAGPRGQAQRTLRRNAARIELPK